MNTPFFSRVFLYVALALFLSMGQEKPMYGLCRHSINEISFKERTIKIDAADKDSLIDLVQRINVLSNKGGETEQYQWLAAEYMKELLKIFKNPHDQKILNQHTEELKKQGLLTLNGYEEDLWMDATIVGPYVFSKIPALEVLNAIPFLIRYNRIHYYYEKPTQMLLRYALEKGEIDLFDVAAVAAENVFHNDRGHTTILHELLEKNSKALENALQKLKDNSLPQEGTKTILALRHCIPLFAHKRWLNTVDVRGYSPFRYSVGLMKKKLNILRNGEKKGVLKNLPREVLLTIKRSIYLPTVMLFLWGAQTEVEEISIKNFLMSEKDLIIDIGKEIIFALSDRQFGTFLNILKNNKGHCERLKADYSELWGIIAERYKVNFQLQKASFECTNLPSTVMCMVEDFAGRSDILNFSIQNIFKSVSSANHPSARLEVMRSPSLSSSSASSATLSEGSVLAAVVASAEPQSKLDPQAVPAAKQ